MAIGERPPAGPRGIIGAAGEAAAADRLRDLGWTVLGRNLQLAETELDIVALEPGRRPTLVIVEVRSRTGSRFGGAAESVDRAKVARLYRAAMTLRRLGHAAISPEMTSLPSWRVDLVTMVRQTDGDWAVDGHLRGLSPP
jgi:putative endonuclease